MGKSSPKRSKQKAVQETRQTKKQIALGRKEARQRRIIFLSLGAVALVVMLVIAFGVVQELVLQPASPVAIVNGVEIRQDDYQNLVTYDRYNQYVTIGNLQDALNQLQASPDDNEFLISFYQQQLTQIQSQSATIPQTALDELIDDELIQQKADKVGITVTAAEVEDRIQQDLRQAFASPQEPVTDTEQLPTPTPVPQDQVDQLFTSILGNIHISEKAFKTIVQRGLLREKMQELLASEVPTTGLVVDVQLIETETEEKALAAKGRIENGEDFAAVASEVSTDTLSVDAGGSLGWVTLDQIGSSYGQPLEELVAAMTVGDMATTESNGMFFVVRLADRNENGPLPDQVLSSKQSSALQDWLTETKASPDVQIERLLEADQIPADPFATAQVP